MIARALAVAGLFVAGALAGCTSESGSKEAGGPPAALAARIAMKDVAFAPLEVRVAVGSTVTWVNEEDVGHAVTPDDAAAWGTPGSGDAPDQYLQKGASWSHRFDAPGTYRYHCAPHATKAGDRYMGMIGTVIVE